MENYSFIRIEENSYSFIKELYLKSFGIKHSPAAIKAKYDTSLFGLRDIGYFAISPDQKPAAYYGVFPMRLMAGDKDFLVAQSGDTMTAPEHQGKGLFTQLAKKTYELAREKGIELVFGFPNKNSFPGFERKLDWKFYGFLQTFTIWNKIIPFCEFAAKYTIIRSLYQSYCNLRLSNYKISPDKENVSVFQHPSEMSYIKKDEEFFKYKLRNPNIYLISINGFILLIKNHPHLIIGAAGFFEKERTQEFLNTLKKLARKLGCRRTIITLSENHWLYGYLKDILQAEENLPIGYFIINPSIDCAAIYFSGADYDTF